MGIMTISSEQIVELLVGDEVSNYFNLLLNFVSKYADIFKDNKNSSLSDNCFSTLNLLEHIDTKIFYNYIDILRELCELRLNKRLKYFYLHMIDYENGGKMKIHNHIHNEDYSFILYLNSCNDGATVFYINGTQYKCAPEKNKLVLFSSNTFHSAEYSCSKKILVGGLKLKYE